MITTQQVRDIIRAHRPNSLIYTNKTNGHKGPERRVKCYYRGDTELLFMLQTAAGSDNVYLTGHSTMGTGRGLIVKCHIG